MVEAALFANRTQSVPVYFPNIEEAVARKAIEHPPFVEWLKGLGQRYEVRSITLSSVDMFGSKVGFIKFQAEVYDRTTNERMPGIVFMRGGSVGILVILECEGAEYALLAVQPRFATGRFAFTEILAGMLDGSGNFVGVAAKELAEEAGPDFAINEKDLHPLTVPGCPIFLSPGGCDETMSLFLYRRKVTTEQLNALSGRATGELGEGERIVLKVVLREELWSIPDAKTILAISLYERQKRG
jgi:ADP-sugar diphosphatase